MDKTILSVIIPVHNRHELFKNCLLSVAGQKSRIGKEIIIVDEASSPSISSYIKNNSSLRNLKNVEIIRNSRALGPSLARTRGLKNAKGEFIAFLDSDDIWERDFLSKTLPVLDPKKPEIASSLVRTIFIGEISVGTRIYFWLINTIRNSAISLLSVFNGNRLPDNLFYLLRLSSTVFTKKAIGDAKFVMSYRTGEDWKFFWDCIRKNQAKITIVEKVLVNTTYHAQSETLRRSGYWRYYYKLMSELPFKMRNSNAIKFFKLYTDFSVWKSKLK